MARSTRTRAISSSLRRQRREREWADFTFSVLSSTITSAVDMLSAYRTTAGTTSGCTVLAWNLQLGLQMAGSPTIQSFVRLGMYVDDRATAVAALENPITQSMAVDWFWNYQLPGQVSATDRPNTDYRGKSGRVLEGAGSTAWLVATPNLSGATSYTIEGHGRVLLALP